MAKFLQKKNTLLIEHKDKKKIEYINVFCNISATIMSQQFCFFQITKSSLKNELIKLYFDCLQSKKTNVSLRRTSNFAFGGSKINGPLGTTLKFLYFLVKGWMDIGRMAV